MTRWRKPRRDPMPLFDQPPAQPHSPTSQAAADSVAPKVADLRAEVLAAITAAGESGLTDLECQERLCMPGDTQRPRRRELEQAGLIRNSGKTRLTPAGKQSVVWVAAT